MADKRKLLVPRLAMVDVLDVPAFESWLGDCSKKGLHFRKCAGGKPPEIKEVPPMEKKTAEALSEPMLYVLMSLLSAQRCGAEIAVFAEGRTAGRVALGPGTLYTILAKFEGDGLIREVSVLGRRRTYALTEQGEARYEAETARLRVCLRDAAESEREAREAAYSGAEIPIWL